MSGHGHMQAKPEYVDQVLRKERFLTQHPEVVIELDREAPPYEEWRGRVPDHKQITSAELGNLLDRLEEIIAVDVAEERWPGWSFTRIGSQWKAQETAGARVVFGPSLGATEARVKHEERIQDLPGGHRYTRCAWCAAVVAGAENVGSKLTIGMPVWCF